MTHLVVKATGRSLLRTLRETAYDKYLNELFNCSINEVGNRPCDNGSSCDLCSAPKLSFGDWLKEKRIVDLQ